MTPYKTKTQKKRALIAIETKANKLFISGVFSVNDLQKISVMLKKEFKKL